jgi:cation:H+ antiporter
MITELIAILGGFALLVWGAERFVTGAAATAANLGVSPLLIGLTIVGFGTSAPEMLVSAMAAWNGNPGLAIGNGIGSNITNIALVLGVTALVIPLQVHSGTLRRELPMLLVTSLIVYGLFLDKHLDFNDGIMLLLGLLLMLGWTIYLGLHSRKSDPMADEYKAEIPTDMSTATALLWLFTGIIILLVSSRILVWGAVGIATKLGISDLIIGLTIVALGTSLPELAASVASALKNEHDIAIGNIIGSNMFNLLAVLGIPGIISPGPVDNAVVTRDFPVMVGLTLALIIMAAGWRSTAGRINRFEAALLLTIYVCYQALLYFTLSA